MTAKTQHFVRVPPPCTSRTPSLRTTGVTYNRETNQPAKLTAQSPSLTEVSVGSLGSLAVTSLSGKLLSSDFHAGTVERCN